ncbi:unnamed protein product [Diamesa hyperborea]
MKHDCEKWRDVIVALYPIFKWEEPYYPGIIAGFLTIEFLLLWWLDFSVLTLVALSALLFTVLDFGYPLVSKFIFKPENWTGTQEKLYENAIQELVDIKSCVCSTIQCFFATRSEKSTVYLLSVTAASIMLAWIGSTFNNLFLLYLTGLVLLMYPGLKEKGIVKLVKDHIKTFVTPYLKKIRPDKTPAADKTE